jgi:ATP-dependent helicase/nuclease subunit A
VYDLAQGRKGWLWEALRNRTDHTETRAILTDLRNRADFLRPFELVDRILTRHDGRRRLIARLGPEAEDGIDQFLGQALAYERMEVPSLTGFLTWLETDEVEVKRQSDAAGDRIRVMTVHGSKGLEAPVVILPDTGDRQAPRGGDTILLGEVPVWQTNADDSPAAIAAAKAESARRWQEENQRLLYVAMTRAESWLVVAAAGKADKDECWHARIRAGLEGAGAEPLETPVGPGLRLGFGDWPTDGAPVQPKTGGGTALPDWAASPAPAAVRPAAPLRPSDLGGAKALPGDAGLPEAEAMARGTALHLLLERLPEHPAQDWPQLAATIPGGPDVLAEARAVLTAPALAPLFAPGTLAEVPFVAGWQGRTLSGTIDRLVVGPDHVLAVDFKSNATLPATPEQVPEGILRQMGAYALALAALYPGRRIDTAILWTAAPGLMPLPHDLVSAALGRATLP